MTALGTPCPVTAKKPISSQALATRRAISMRAALGASGCRAAAMSITGKPPLIATASNATPSSLRRSDRLDLDQPLRRDQRLDDDRRRAGASVAEMLCPHRAGRWDVFRAHQIRGDLHQIPDSHPGIREDR